MNNIMTSISYDVLQDILVERLGDVIYHTCAKDSLENLRKNNYLRKSMIDIISALLSYCKTSKKKNQYSIYCT